MLASYSCNALVSAMASAHTSFLTRLWAPRMLLRLRGAWRLKRDGGARLVAFRQADVGKSVEIRGDVIWVDEEERLVRWTGAHHFDLEGEPVHARPLVTYIRRPHACTYAHTCTLVDD